MTSIRRAYLLRSLRFEDLYERGLASAYRGKQLREPGQRLPEGFPAGGKLSAAGYLAFEDLEGARALELERAGLDTQEVLAVLSALEARESTDG